MKNTFLRLTSLFMVFLMLALAFASCEPNFEKGYCTVVVGQEGSYTEYKVELSKADQTDGVLGLVKYLEEKEHIKANYENSIYGAYFLSIGSVVPDATKSEYVAIYTSVEADFDTSLYFMEKDYLGIKLGTSGLGVSSMTIKEGAVYLFTIGSY